MELDLSNCLWLTNRTPAAIARHCHSLERLGLRNMRELNGTELSRLFLDKRAKNFKSITLSGSKNVSGVSITIVTGKKGIGNGRRGRK